MHTSASPHPPANSQVRHYPLTPSNRPEGRLLYSPWHSSCLGWTVLALGPSNPGPHPSPPLSIRARPVALSDACPHQSLPSSSRVYVCVSDNHDIMALSTYDDLGIHPEADDLVVTPKFGTPPRHPTHHPYRPLPHVSRPRLVTLVDATGPGLVECRPRHQPDGGGTGRAAGRHDVARARPDR